MSVNLFHCLSRPPSLSLLPSVVAVYFSPISFALPLFVPLPTQKCPLARFRLSFPPCFYYKHVPVLIAPDLPFVWMLCWAQGRRVSKELYKSPPLNNQLKGTQMKQTGEEGSDSETITLSHTMKRLRTLKSKTNKIKITTNQRRLVGARSKLSTTFKLWIKTKGIQLNVI